MNTIKILGEAIGIQSKGVVDKTETQTRDRLTSAMIVGRFMRGRTDKPMTIHQGNIRGQLGYEPNNLDYIAVQDCLDTGLPSIQVLRIGIQSAGGSQISCAGATIRAHFLTSPDTYQKQWSVELDGIIYDLAFDANLSNYYMPQEVSDVLHINGDGDWFIENRTSDIHRVRFIPDEDSLPVESPDIDLASITPRFILMKRRELLAFV
ncbi:hypothetical protein AVENLUH7437_01547 [Acinetobacter venetianus]|nr:hypothetical protein [Acinetobacter venetianus]KXZ65131.1 hypothetical protein AVENLUH7437_01547 [Acinetobacter venetianus]